MTVKVPSDLEAAIRGLAATRGEELDRIVEKALRDFIVAESITDVTPAEIAATQEAMLPELNLPPWDDSKDENEAG